VGMLSCSCFFGFIVYFRTPFSMVSYIYCEILHLSIPFLSLFQDSALISSASNDLQVSTSLQSSLSPHMQQGFTSPYHCACRAPVYLRLWHIFVVCACLSLDIRFNAVSYIFHHMFWNECVVHFFSPLSIPEDLHRKVVALVFPSSYL
jgi:hypothetical protein